MNRHDAHQIAAERLAEQMGGFSVRHRPGATLSLSEPVLAAVFARALNAGLIVVPGRVQGHHHEYVGGRCIHCPKPDTDLETLASRWPETLQLFSAAGELIVLPNDDSAWVSRPGRAEDGGMPEIRLDEDGILARIHGISNDGGDPW